MQDLLFKLITLLFFIVATGLFYAAVTATYPTVFINLVLIIVSIFVLLQAFSRVDKSLGLGDYAKNKQNNENNNEM
jgi:hypothetical protein